MNEGYFNVSKPNGWKMKVWLTLIILSGIVLIVVALGLRSATYTWKERQVKTETVGGNRGFTTTVGACVGAGTGVGVGAALGGVGIACCGTGIGVPVGVVCLGLAGLFGVAGGAVGAAVGSSAHDVETVEWVTHVSPWVASWVWMSLFGVGCVLIICGAAGFVWLKRVGEAQEGMSNDK